jgi:hypothetical protein
MQQFGGFEITQQSGGFEIMSTHARVVLRKKPRVVARRLEVSETEIDINEHSAKLLHKGVNRLVIIADERIHE